MMTDDLSGAVPPKTSKPEMRVSRRISLKDRIRRDIFSPEALIAPVSGFLLSLLLTLIIVITIVYAPAQYSAYPTIMTFFERDTIPVEAGYAAVALISAVAIFAAIGPLLRRRVMLGQGGKAPRIHLERLLLPFGVFWSSIDLLFGEALARVAGSTFEDVRYRYGIGFCWVAFGILAGLYFPPHLGLPVVLFVIAMIFGVARRWSWIEKDRQRYMIERGRRPNAEIVGYSEDLRDEALFGIVCLFALAPLALAQTQWLSCTWGAETCAFTVRGSGTLGTNTFEVAISWLGYFGVELVKALPFVDWSEVFRVTNASPIDPATPFGAQVVFFTRACLDLVLLGSVIQAVQVSSQLRSQRTSFDARQLPLLEPFEEDIEFSQVNNSLVEGADISAPNQPRVRNIDHYNISRLQQIAADEYDDDTSRGYVASAILASKAANRIFEADAERVDTFFTATIPECTDERRRRSLARLSCQSEPEFSDEHNSHVELLENDLVGGMIKSAIIRTGYMMGNEDGRLSSAMEHIVKNNDDRYTKTRLDAALCLARRGVPISKDVFYDYMQRFQSRTPKVGLESQSLVVAGVGAAVLGLDQPSWLKQGLNDNAAELLRRGFNMHERPMSVAEATGLSTLDERFDQSVLLLPGEFDFPSQFLFGSAEGASSTRETERPQQLVEVSRRFAVGCFAVRMAEWRSYRISQGLSALGYEDNANWPAVEISWRDVVNYAEWLTNVSGIRWRMPREVEWEYACRSGTETAYSWGNDWDKGKANSNESSPSRLRNVMGEDGIGEYCNSWGLWQMHGNVTEWCQCPWSESLEHTPQKSTDVREAGDHTRAVLRGGSWFNPGTRLTSHSRDWGPRSYRYASIGARLCREVSKFDIPNSSEEIPT